MLPPCSDLVQLVSVFSSQTMNITNKYCLFIDRLVELYKKIENKTNMYYSRRSVLLPAWYHGIMVSQSSRIGGREKKPDARKKKEKKRS